MRIADAAITNLCEIGIQGSRPAEILKLWLTLQHVGERQFAELIETWVHLADAIAEQARRRPFLSVACQPESAIACFRGTPQWVPPYYWDAWTAGLHREAASREGIHLSLVPYAGAKWLRAVFANPFAEASIVDRLFAVVDEYAAESRETAQEPPV